MHELLKTILISCFLISLASPVKALGFKDKDLPENTYLNPIKLSDYMETHFDATVTNDFLEGFAGPNQSHRAILDYRVETHLPLYNLSLPEVFQPLFGKTHQARLVTRFSGVGFLDENINKFLDDPLIDIPEIFVEDEMKSTDNKFKIVFGKFANRRFFNKDEIVADPFDIGERRFAGALVNTLNLLSAINEFRDSDLVQSGTRDATGSYGFMFEVKNHKPESHSLRANWGFKQALAVSQMNNFASNFYSISEVNKNWGSNQKPGQFNLGFLAANNSVYRMAGNDKNDYLIYSSWVQKINRFSNYLRWGSLFTEDPASSANVVLNEARYGVNYKLTDKDSLTSWIGYFDYQGYLGFTNYWQWVNVYAHNITDNLVFRTALTGRFNQANPSASDGLDNDWTIAVHVSYFQ